MADQWPGERRASTPRRSPNAHTDAYGEAVASIDRSRTVATTPHQAWDVLADFGAISSWADNVDHSCILNQSDGALVGTVRRVQVGRNALTERITEFAPTRALGYQIDGLPRRLRRVTNR